MVVLFFAREISFHEREKSFASLRCYRSCDFENDVLCLCWGGFEDRDFFENSLQYFDRFFFRVPEFFFCDRVEFIDNMMERKIYASAREFSASISFCGTMCFLKKVF